MKVAALRQLLHDLPDDMDIGFMSDSGEDYSINVALPDKKHDVLIFGESELGVIEAWEEYLRGFDEDSPDDEDDEEEDGGDGPKYDDETGTDNPLCSLPERGNIVDNDKIMVEDF